MSTITDAFQSAFDQLNDAQRQAVTTTEGPVLVIAGPGTGKTQLLSTRAAHIVRTGRGGAHNILCLTFTDAGAVEMRNRMSRIMGPTGNEVAVHTFHGFGRWLINEYPEQFSTLRSQKPLDDLTRHHLFEELLSKLPLRHPLAMRGEHDEFARQDGVQAAIKAFKDAGLSPDDLRALFKRNQADYRALEPLWPQLFDTTLSVKRLDNIEQTVDQYLTRAKDDSFTTALLHDLLDTLERCRAQGKTEQLGKWRDKHLERQNGSRALKSQVRNKLHTSLVDLYEQYQTLLTDRGLFDYEDMVLRAINLLETNQDIVLDVAERFQYIMVDEFQDTSGAQNRMLDALLGAHPTDEPNVLAVGDDDQAIMRFQGAELSGMVRFAKEYTPTVIVLTQNYRSGQAILDAAGQIIAQTDERLIVELPELHLSKDLTARSDAPRGTITYTTHVSPSAQYQSVAQHIKQLQARNVQGSDIAIIASKHRELVAVSPYLEAAGISVSYDRRETVLEEPHIAQLLDVAAYIRALAEHPKRAEALLPRVLSADCWGLPAQAIYDIAAHARHAKQNWLDAMLASDKPEWQQLAEWFLSASRETHHRNFTQMFDILIGREALPDTALKHSPYQTYLDHTPTENTVRLLSHLIRLRQAVLEARPNATGLDDLLAVCDDYKRSGIKIVDDNPLLRGSSDSVQLLTGHGAKGREFDHVILLSTVENIWGPKASGNSTRIALPENLQIYPAGNNDADKLRLLYVAMTRAKSNLSIAAYSKRDDGKKVEALSFLQLGEGNGWWQPTQTPQPAQDETVRILANAWSAQPTAAPRSLQQLLQPIMPRFRLSPSALNSFLNVKYAGPQSCIEQHVLKFPSAYNEHSALGSAVHEIMQQSWNAHKKATPFTDEKILELFDVELDASGVPAAQLSAVRAHGHEFLPKFVRKFSNSDFARITSVERFLTATLPNGTPISGQLDAIEMNKHTISIIDYKTGKPPANGWSSTGLTDSKKLSLHTYRQQLLFYKLLVEHSLDYQGKTVELAELVFAEPAEDNDEIVRLRIDQFDDKELERTEQLICAVYNAIKRGDLPDISNYPPTLKGVLAFEDDLLANL